MVEALSFGKLLKAQRRELGLTQDEMARRVGCAPITVRKIEADDLRPSVQVAERLFVGYGTGVLLIWDSASGQLLGQSRSHSQVIANLALSPDGTRLATASWDGTSVIMDSVTGDVLKGFFRHTDKVWGVSYSPDGKRVATASFDGTVRVWDAASGKELLLLPHTPPDSPDRQVVTVAFSPDGRRIASGSWGPPSVALWDAVSGEKLSSFDVVGGANTVIFSPDSRFLAVVSPSSAAAIWDVTGREPRLKFTLAGHTGNTTSVVYRADGSQLATVGWDGQIKLWDAATGKEVFTITALGAKGSYAAAFSPDGNYLSVTEMGGMTQVYLLRLEELKALARSRVTRSLTLEECQQYLHTQTCP